VAAAVCDEIFGAERTFSGVFDADGSDTGGVLGRDEGTAAEAFLVLAGATAEVVALTLGLTFVDPEAPVAFAIPPLVGPPDADAGGGPPNRISGSTNSAGDAAAAGAKSVSVRASAAWSIRAPCASRSCSESGHSEAPDVEAGLVSPVGAAALRVPDEEAAADGPIGSSMGKSASGSGSGREAASIVFEPAPGQTILNVSCNAGLPVRRRWLTD
jgi:hypothetical protein